MSVNESFDDFLILADFRQGYINVEILERSLL